MIPVIFEIKLICYPRREQNEKVFLDMRDFFIFDKEI
jgi:hypothetical protein